MTGADVPEIVHQPEPLAADIATVRGGLMRFFERLGYEVFGLLEGFPAGTRTYYLKKTL